MENGHHNRNLSAESLTGVFSATGAFVIWGLNPIYFKVLDFVPAFEILMHRIIWSFFFLLPIVFLLGRWEEFINAITAVRTLLILCATTLLISSNWFIFIWAINSDKILHTSLGYYITPLINVLLGMIFLRERLRPAQTAAVLLAFVSVFYLTVQIGTLPWVSLFLSITFGFYGLIRKIAPVNALVGITIETLLLSGPAIAYLIYLDAGGSGAFLQINTQTNILLISAAFVTGLPLMLFTFGARRIHLATLGILQYIAPSCTFFLAVFIYHEPFKMAQVWTFAIIWIALIIYSTDSVIYYRYISGRR
jgi:chloramphenicol-sensitive protein RarD